MTTSRHPTSLATRLPLAGVWRRRVSGHPWLLLGLPAFLFLLLFFVAPLAALFVRTLQDVPEGGAWYSNYAQAFTSEIVRDRKSTRLNSSH